LEEDLFALSFDDSRFILQKLFDGSVRLAKCRPSERGAGKDADVGTARDCPNSPTSGAVRHRNMRKEVRC
jgi:hypothetical protein